MNRKTLGLYWQQVRKHRKSFFFMLFAIPLGVLFIDTLLPYFLSQAIGGLADKQPDVTKINLIYGAIIGGVGALINFVGFRTMVHHESSVLADLRSETFKSLIKKDYAFFANQKIGAMTSRYIDFVRNETTIQDLAIIRTLGFILSVGGGLIILAASSIAAALMILALLVVLLLQIRWSTKIRAPYRHKRKELTGIIHGVVADAISNNVIVKTFAAESREIKNVRELSDQFRIAYKKDATFLAGEGSIRVAIMTSVQVLAIIAATSMVASNAITIATAIFMLAYLQRIGSQLFVLGDIINGYDRAFLDSSPMTEMLLTNDEVFDAEHPVKFSPGDSSIVFSDVNYSYKDGKQNAISNYNLHIPAGQKVGIVGHSGAGKTTIVQLLLRFADLTSGSIKVGGFDTKSIKQTALRSYISYVPQEPMLFHRTLRENIAYGNPDASDEQIMAAAEKAYATEFITTLPDGIDTIVGERGVKLSGGQRQRIAIARAILKNAPVLLLDEATSALDSESENLIQKSLKSLMKDRTSIVIAHRLSTIARLDRIIVMDKGRIVEDGTHEGLLKLNGTYAKLWNHQSGGFIDE